MVVAVKITPCGDLRIVFAGPAQLLKTRLKQGLILNEKRIEAAAAALMVHQGGRIRPKEEDEEAQSMFELVGSKKTAILPLERLTVLELPTDEITATLKDAADALVRPGGPFSSWGVVENIVRIFGNGYATVALTIEFKRKRGVRAAVYLDYLRRQFAVDAPANAELRAEAEKALASQVGKISTSILSGRFPRRRRPIGRVPFLSTVYVLGGRWADPRGKQLHLIEDLRPMLQPEAGEPLLNQSTSGNELVIYTSAVHIYMYNVNVKSPAIAFEKRRTILVCFLNLMNVLYAQIDDTAKIVEERLKRRWVSLRVPTDIDERLNILYNQVMVLSTWRRDTRSFTDQINKRWRLHELKEYCLALISALEAKSQARRRTLINIILFIVAVAQVVSVIADWEQLSTVHPWMRFSG